MYITLDLFGGHSTHDCRNHTTSTFWENTMAESPQTAGLGKRKRHDAVEEGPNAYTGSCVAHIEHDTSSQYRHMHHQRSSPAGRRCRDHGTSLGDISRTDSQTHCSYPPSPPHSFSERRPQKQIKRLGPKAALIKSASHLMDTEPDSSTISLSHPGAHHQHAVADLRSCHACNSAPRRRKELENYLDCTRCHGRTCYICARQCFGRCGKAVCKKCIVEVGEEGDPWCLDCYARNINS